MNGPKNRMLCHVSILLMSFASLGKFALPQAVQQGVPTLRETVRNVLVDVVVTDRDGNPVHGISADKFQLLDNGSPRKLAFFEEHRGDAAPPVHLPPLHLPPNVYTNFDEVPANGPAIVLLIDALNTPQAAQMRVRQAIVDTLQEIPAGTQVAIFSLNERLRMIQGFNGDPAILKAALDKATAWQKQSRLTDDPGQDSYYDGLGDPSNNAGVAAAAVGIEGSLVAHEQAFRVRERIALTLGAMHSLALYLAAMPGRKNLIWFSGAFPISMGAKGLDGALRIETATDATRDMRKVADLLTLARVAVYPVNALGLTSPEMFQSNQSNQVNLSNSGIGGGTRNLDQVGNDAFSDISQRETMYEIAADTGGEPFINHNDMRVPIRAVEKLGSNYYTLGYAPGFDKPDGKYHKIVVKVDVPKAQLEYRHGYFADDPAQSGADKLPQPSAISSVLLCGAPGAKDILFKVRVAPAANATANPKTHTLRYSINWVVDEHGIQFDEAGGKRNSKIDLAAIAYDVDGKPLTSVNSGASLSLTPAEYQNYLKTGLVFHQELDLSRGLVHLRLAVLDRRGNRAGATEIPMFVGTPAARSK